jgi:hypothetical protein
MMKSMKDAVKKAADMANNQNDFAGQAFQVSSSGRVEAVKMKVVMLTIFRLKG